MLGRGTRRCDEINKSKFVIFDCFEGTLIRYFKDVSNFKIEEPRKDPMTIQQIIDNIWQNVDRAYHVGVLVKRLRRIERDMSGKAREDFAKWIPDGDVGGFAAVLPGKLRGDFNGTMQLLRKGDFQDVLQNYERAKRQFWVAHDVKDEVTSRPEYRFGKFDRAEDYLEAFARFVTEYADQVDALSILLQRPKDWKPEALDQLRKVLRQADYEEIKLQKAHEKVSHKALADIISMVKHAARQQEPLLTAQERVTRAMKQILDRHHFTSEQLQWLELIETHLVSQLTIAENDFDLLPIFEQRGGKSRARKIFNMQLEPLIEELNAAVAA